MKIAISELEHLREEVKNCHKIIKNLQKKREFVGLTDEERNDCLVSADPCECLANPEAHQLMEDVEAKLKEKNGIAPQGSSK
jgi:uncharacterized Fe-S cluster-containing protein